MSVSLVYFLIFIKILIVYDDIEPKYDENGILYIGLKQFLLDENIIDF
ncbi:conserved hypothetical protein [Mycoplasma leachii PG50]|uniref:Uncharacterized protein n=1 Tax=Mycoplasma leachii (strain DSM 21131 / NCTC 10133 / N29 / PG50) TaxID=880447 RepID=E4PTI9_MYCLG|nr:hypothetical protein [Mycoplasma leachii]ADR24431.1 conserved hypothetical protein [Mycoplasma leachii PG50]CBV67151.1 Hypothetical ATPase [Mycoplasma leachii 99/014/6]